MGVTNLSVVSGTYMLYLILMEDITVKYLNYIIGNAEKLELGNKIQGKQCYSFLICFLFLIQQMKLKVLLAFFHCGFVSA